MLESSQIISLDSERKQRENLVVGRLDFQLQWALGTIVNIGCGDDPTGFGARAVHVDLDVWNHPHFVQANAKDLPFKDKQFDTAVLGDILEHVVGPLSVVSEASRVGRRLIMTIPEETRLPSVGCHPELGVRDRAVAYREQHPDFPADLSDEEIVVEHKKRDIKFISAYPETVEWHDGHIWWYDEAWIQRLIAESKKKLVKYEKVPECTWMNWLIVLDD